MGRFLLQVLSIGVVLAHSTAAAEPSQGPPDLVGLWSGEFTMLTLEGVSKGVTHYEFTEQTGNLLKGENRWRVLSAPRDVSGEESLPRGTNSFLGVIAEDDTIFLVADGDLATRRLRVTSRDTIDFVEFAGGDNLVVVSVKLIRRIQRTNDR